MAKRTYTPHAGEILGDAMRDAGLSANALAIALRVPASRLQAILAGKRSITADTAFRLGRYFGTSVKLWMGIQMECDLRKAEAELKERIEREITPRLHAA